MPKSRKSRLDREISEAIGSPKRPGQRPSRKAPAEIRRARLETLQAIMADVLDAGWLETLPQEIDSWISVDDELSDRQWLNEAKDQLINQSVLPEHAGAPPERVRRWNDVFIATYIMNVDADLSHQDAIDSARQNASDTVRLRPGEHELVRDDPELYPSWSARSR